MLVFALTSDVLGCSELRERIQPEILELIKQQRLNRLCEGSCFRKLGNRRRQGRPIDTWLWFLFYWRGHCCCIWSSSEHRISSAFFLEKFWFCRLSLNHKVLHYGDLDESPQGEVPFELLSDKSKTNIIVYFSKGNAQHDFILCLHVESVKTIANYMWRFNSPPTVPVSDIKSVVTGKDCPHMKEKSALKQNKVLHSMFYIHVTRYICLSAGEYFLLWTRFIL